MKRATFLLIVPLLLAVVDARPDSGETTNAWVALFSGRDLTGWRAYGGQARPGPGWKVEDGILKKLARERGGDIITEQTFDNYELEWEWRIAKNGNNGLKYLVTEARRNSPGHEYQMFDDFANGEAKPGQKHMTGSFYDVLPPVITDAGKPAGEWNHSRLLIQGNHVEHWLNGKKILTYELGSAEVRAAVARSKFRDAPGFGEKIRGHIMLTDHGDECWFRNIRVRKLK